MDTTKRVPLGLSGLAAELFAIAAPLPLDERRALNEEHDRAEYDWLGGRAVDAFVERDETPSEEDSR